MTAIARKLLNRKSETVRLPIPQEQNLDEYVAAKFIPYTGKSSRDIASELQVSAAPTAKNYNSSLAFCDVGRLKIIN